MTSLAGWDLLEPIGAGAHAVVHRAVRRDRPGRVVAIKRVAGVGADAVAALEREAVVLRDLSHPAIAVLHEVLVEPDGIALVLGLATGGSLAGRLARAGRLPWPQVADLGARLAGALAVAHDVGIVHRDVKPSNILFGREDEPRLADFGLARLVDDVPGEIVGTAGYLDPEVANGAVPGPAADTWALGVVLWEALAGQPPFGGDDPAAVRRAVDRGQHLPLADLVPDAAPALVTAVETAMARDPADRFESARDLQVALEAIAADAESGPVATAVGRQPDRSVPDGVGTMGAGAPGPAGSDDPATGGVVRTVEPPPDPTTTWGPRPRAVVAAEGDPRAWVTHVVVGLAVVVPLVAAAWALLAGFGGAPASMTTPLPSPGQARSSAPAPGATTASAAAETGPTSRPTGAPDDWVRRRSPERCREVDGRHLGAAWADVDGRGCGLPVRITVARVDGERHHVIEVGGTTPAAGRWDLGPGLRVAILGDWDADGVDTPAVVTADGVAWHFEEWSDATAVRLGTAPVTGRVAVATDPTGRDHLVSMDAAATLPKPPGD